MSNEITLFTYRDNKPWVFANDKKPLFDWLYGEVSRQEGFDESQVQMVETLLNPFDDLVTLEDELRLWLADIRRDEGVVSVKADGIDVDIIFAIGGSSSLYRLIYDAKVPRAELLLAAVDNQTAAARAQGFYDAYGAKLWPRT